MVGIGSTPEGINQNHINFELLYEMAWRGNQTIDRFQWMHQYVMRRYNDKNGITKGFFIVFFHFSKMS